MPTHTPAERAKRKFKTRKNKKKKTANKVDNVAEAASRIFKSPVVERGREFKASEAVTSAANKLSKRKFKSPKPQSLSESDPTEDDFATPEVELAPTKLSSASNMTKRKRKVKKKKKK